MQRFAILIYGVFAYLAFFATITYAMGFLSGFLVPKNINTGPAVPLMEAILTDSLLLLFFGVTHSIMARPAFKAMITKIIPAAAERSTFVLVASCQLALAFYLWRPITHLIWSTDNTALEWIIRAISASGWIIVFWSSFLIDHFDLFGLRQVWLNFQGIEYSHKAFTVRSLYKYVRHPLMLGFLLAFWFTPVLTVGHLLFALLSSAYIFVGVFLEERDLQKHLGEDYQNYKNTTSMIIPWVGR